ncbi:MAG: Sec-independent protein translocase protein TatB [Acidimicrobiales bacterium]
MFFNIGGGEILVIAMVALIAVGPEQLPGLLRKIGRFLGQARSVTSNLRDEFMSGIDEVNELADPDKWMGSGSADDPVVPRGYAEQQSATNPAQRRSSDPRSNADGEGAPGETKPVVNEVAAANAMRAEEPADDPSSSLGVEEPVDEESVDEEPVDEQPVDEQPVDEEPLAAKSDGAEDPA